MNLLVAYNLFLLKIIDI